jgi:hypothetical protein
VRALPAIAVAAAAAVWAVAAPGAEVHPKALVLTRSHLPAGCVLKEGRPYSNESFSGGQRRSAELVARSGRVGGYTVTFENATAKRSRVIRSRVDEFSRPAGAHLVLATIDADQQGRNVGRGLLADGRERAGIGAESWVYWAGHPSFYVFVMWRHGRWLGIVDSWGVGRERTLALARVQQRRMATKLG